MIARSLYSNTKRAVRIHDSGDQPIPYAVTSSGHITQYATLQEPTTDSIGGQMVDGKTIEKEEVDFGYGVCCGLLLGRNEMTAFTCPSGQMPTGFPGRVERAYMHTVFLIAIGYAEGWLKP